LNIGFIGAGKVGQAFGKYLVINGFHVVGFYSKTFASSIKAAELTNSKAYKKIEELVKDANIIFITTPDDVIKEVCDLLAAKKLFRKEQIVCHTSGALSSDVLKSARGTGCSIYSLHPLQAFADVEKSVQELESTIFSIEGSEDRIQCIIKFMNDLGNDFFRIDTNKKVIYHAAACVVSNYLVTLLGYAIDLLNEIGIDQENSIKAMYPLIIGTIENITKMEPEKALTGPIARGDIETIERHLNEMGKNYPHYLEFYKLLGKKTVELAQKEKLKDQNKINKLNQLLGGK